jgi:uncharacterized metal-binding protein
VKDHSIAECAKCFVKDRMCSVEGGRGPEFCPTKNYRDIIEKALGEYEKAEVREFARMASIQEAECYLNRHIQPYILHPSKPRVQEICEFANKMGYKNSELLFAEGFAPKRKHFLRSLKLKGLK